MNTAAADFNLNNNLLSGLVNDLTSKYASISQNFASEIVQKVANLVVGPLKLVTSKQDKQTSLISNISSQIVEKVPEVTDSNESSLLKDIIKKIDNLLDKKEPTTSIGKTPYQKEKETPQPKTFFDKVIKVQIDGITNDGFTNLKEKLPKIFEEVFKKMPKEKIQPQDGKSLNDKFAEGGLMGLFGLTGISGFLKFLTGLSGIFTAIYAITTSSPWKGLSKMIAQGLLSVSGLTKAVQGFVDNFITRLIKLPEKIFFKFAGWIEKIFGSKALDKVLTIGAKMSDNIIFKALKGALTLIKKIPLIGTLLSVGMAVDRIRKGDYFGGFLEVLSGIAAIFPGIGTGIAFAIDGLNAFLDYKAGGIGEGKPSKGALFLDMLGGVGKWIYDKIKYVPVIGPMIEFGEALYKKDWVGSLYHLVRIVPILGSIMDFVNYKSSGAYEDGFRQGTINFGEWIANITSLVSEKVKNIPYLGSLARAFEHMQKGEWLEGLKSLGHSIPFISELLDFLGYSETTIDGETIETTNLDKTVNLFADLGTWVKETIIDKITGWVGGIYDWTKEKLFNIGEKIGNFFSFGSDIKEPKQDIPKLKDGGVVTKPTQAIVGEAGPEAVIPLNKYMTPETGSDAVIPLDKYMTPETMALSNTMLEKIAANTGVANDSLTKLYQAIFKLAEVFNSKQDNSQNNLLMMGGEKQPNQYPSASQIAASNRDPIRQVRLQFMPPQITQGAAYG